MAAIGAVLRNAGYSEDREVVALGDHIEGLLEALNHASKEEKRDILSLMLDAACVDTRAKSVVALRVKAAFTPSLRAWLAAKKPEECPVQLGEINIVHGDPERIRTADLWLDRPIC